VNAVGKSDKDTYRKQIIVVIGTAPDIRVFIVLISGRRLALLIIFVRRLGGLWREGFVVPLAEFFHQDGLLLLGHDQFFFDDLPNEPVLVLKLFTVTPVNTNPIFLCHVSIDR
jgi:hypothetical protein